MRKQPRHSRWRAISMAIIPPKESPPTKQGSTRVNMFGHSSSVPRQIVARLWSNPSGKTQIAELLALEAKDPLVGPHSRQQNQWQLFAHVRTAGSS